MSDYIDCDFDIKAIMDEVLESIDDFDSIMDTYPIDVQLLVLNMIARNLNDMPEIIRQKACVLSIKIDFIGGNIAFGDK
jgi:hypothetical protein